MRRILIISALSLFLLGCSKNETPPPYKSACETNNTYSLQLSNGSNEIFSISINGKSYGALEGHKQKVFDVPAGYTVVVVTQETGIDKIKVTYDGSYSACDNRSLIFP